MKKLILIFMAAVCLVVFVACNGCGGKNNDTELTATATETPDYSTRNPEANEGGEDAQRAREEEAAAETPAPETPAEGQQIPDDQNVSMEDPG